MGYHINLRGSPTLIFEPKDAYLKNNAAEGFWGPPTSSIDW